MVTKDTVYTIKNQENMKMLKKIFTIYFVTILSCTMASGYEIVIDSTYTMVERDDSKQVVYDRNTALIWQDDASAKTVQKNWQGAINYCKNLSLDGQSDWRLPSLEELKTIVDKSNSPTIKKEFKNTASDDGHWYSYWSSTPYADNSNGAWSVHFEDGHEEGNGKWFDDYVRCVRDSK